MLKGHRINIRKINQSDLVEFVKLVTDDSNYGEFLSVSRKDEIELRKEFDENGFISDRQEQFIIENSQCEIIGIIWAFKSVPYFEAIEVGYQIFKDEFRRKGFATEAMSMFVDYLFESKKINRVELRIATENLPSEKIAIKAQFNLEGTCREAVLSNGKLNDMNLYALLRSEWSANKQMQTDAAKAAPLI
jgi:RimJ/RimL family protein N-acetyltransferase